MIKCTIKDITVWANNKDVPLIAVQIGELYHRFVNFTVVVLYMSNGLSPSPEFERKFSSQTPENISN